MIQRNKIGKILAFCLCFYHKYIVQDWSSIKCKRKVVLLTQNRSLIPKMNIYEYAMMGGGGGWLQSFTYHANLLCIYFSSRLSGDYWLGLHDVNAGSSREFYWHDCRPFLPSDWSRWDPVGDEPDNPSTQRCIRIFYGKWRTVECHIARRFICEAQKGISCFS